MPDAASLTLSGLPSEFEMVHRVPGTRLSGIVSRMSGYREAAAGHFRQVQPASLVAPLIINFGGPFAIGLGRAPRADDRFTSFAAGLFAGPVVIDSFGCSNCLQIDFTPLGARQFFHMPMTELTDRMVALDDVLGAEGVSFRDNLANEPSWARRFALAECFVARRVEAARAVSLPVAWAYDRLLATGGRIPVLALAREIGWSRKHLVDRCNAEIGLGPKTLARVVRFRRVMALSQGRKSGGWADIAAAGGYADQSHLARDFRELAGTTPAAWLSQAG
ncbi:AraC family transcriptional regulator [soil metagenome]